MIHEREEGRRDRVKQEWCKKWKWDGKRGGGVEGRNATELGRMEGWWRRRDEKDVGWRDFSGGGGDEEKSRADGAALWRQR